MQPAQQMPCLLCPAGLRRQGSGSILMDSAPIRLLRLFPLLIKPCLHRKGSSVYPSRTSCHVLLARASGDGLQHPGEFVKSATLERKRPARWVSPWTAPPAAAPPAAAAATTVLLLLLHVRPSLAADCCSQASCMAAEAGRPAKRLAHHAVPARPAFCARCVSAAGAAPAPPPGCRATGTAIWARAGPLAAPTTTAMPMAATIIRSEMGGRRGEAGPRWKGRGSEVGSGVLVQEGEAFPSPYDPKLVSKACWQRVDLHRPAAVACPPSPSRPPTPLTQPQWQHLLQARRRRWPLHCPPGQPALLQEKVSNACRAADPHLWSECNAAQRHSCAAINCLVHGPMLNKPPAARCWHAPVWPMPALPFSCIAPSSPHRRLQQSAIDSLACNLQPGYQHMRVCVLAVPVLSGLLAAQ